MKSLKKIKDRWVESLALLVAIIALLLSWQANNIALQQVSPRVVVLSSLPTYFPRQPIINLGELPRKVYCDQVIRVANLGGAGSTIVGFGVTFRLSDETIEEESIRNFIIEVSGDKTMGRLGHFFAELIDIDNVTAIDYPKPKQSQLPIQLDPYKTRDIYGWTQFLVLQQNLSEKADLPLEVLFKLYLSNGEIINSPVVQCQY